MFIKELSLYIDYWLEQLTDAKEQIDQKRNKYVQTLYENIMSGITYYREMADKVSEETSALKHKITEGLDEAEQKLQAAYEQHFLSESLNIPLRHQEPQVT